MLLSPELFRSIFSYSLFLFGLVFVGAGFWKLMAFSMTNHAVNLALQSARAGQKAISDDIARITQAISQLNDSVNTLLKTSAGVGAFLIFTGLTLLAASFAVMFVL
jgi:hypothetical protein